MAYFTTKSLVDIQTVERTVDKKPQEYQCENLFVREIVEYITRLSEFIDNNSPKCSAENIQQQQNQHGNTMSSSYSKQTTSIPKLSRSSRKALILCIVAVILSATNARCARMVRLCIASVDPVKLSSQCVMCNRREFPLTVIDCTGITKVNDLISNPLSVQEATCLIYNCRQQVPDAKPEPYHGSVSHAARANFPSASGTRKYEMMPPSGMFGDYSGSLSTMRYGGVSKQNSASMPPISPLASGNLVGGPNMMAGRQQALPYVLVPAPYTFPFGRKYKAALVPLFR